MCRESRRDLTQGAFYQELILGKGRSTEGGFNWMCLYTLLELDLFILHSYRESLTQSEISAKPSYKRLHMINTNS